MRRGLRVGKRCELWRGWGNYDDDDDDKRYVTVYCYSNVALYEVEEGILLYPSLSLVCSRA